MKNLLLSNVLIFILIFVFTPFAGSTFLESLHSPDKNIKIVFTNDSLKSGYSNTAGLFYSVLLNSDTVINWSSLGISVSEPNISENVEYLGYDSILPNDEIWYPKSGKHSIVHNNFLEKTYHFTDNKKNKLDVVFRSYNDGIAFCYKILGSGKAVTNSEYSNFILPKNSTVWMQEVSKNYEAQFDSFAIGTSIISNNYGCFPMLVKTPKNKWELITESAVYGNYTASRFNIVGTNFNGIKIHYPQVSVIGKLPLQTPWRVIIIGNNLSNIIESDIVDNLNSPSESTDLSWIKPGRVAWSWWSDGNSTSDLNVQKEYVDFASYMGWEYILADEGWSYSWIQELVDYASSKNVGVIVWFRWSDMDASMERLDLMNKLESYGIKGIKVDFIDNDNQDRMRFYQDVLEDAMTHHLMVSFHGSTIPRGQRRRWPNLMTMEGVRGAEHYHKKDKIYGYPSPWQNCMLPFTRNVIGPMDYTPVTFSTPNRTTTMAHELALSVVFESGLQHFADSPQSYKKSGCENFLKKVPSFWDDTKFISGYPGEFACFARRSGRDWFFAGINSGDSREITLPLSEYLKPQSYNIKIYLDSINGSIKILDTTINSKNDLKLTMNSNGGFCFYIDNSIDTTKDSISVLDNIGDKNNFYKTINFESYNKYEYKLSLPMNSKYEIVIVTANGRKLFKRYGYFKNEITISSNKFSRGLNLVYIKSDDDILIKRVIIE